jgi:hypothetical protein
MENSLKILETTLAERNAMVRILQSQASGASSNINNLEELLAAKMGNSSIATPTHVHASHGGHHPLDNILNIPIHSPAHKKQFSTPSNAAAILAAGTPTHQYHSLKKHQMAAVAAGHAHRSLTPSADMFFHRGNGGGGHAPPPHHSEYMRSATPSADFLRGTPTSMTTPTAAELMRVVANTDLMASHAHRSLTPSSGDMFFRGSGGGGGHASQQHSHHSEYMRSATPSAEFLRGLNNDLLRATPTSAELHRLSAPSSEMLRATPISVEMMQRGTPGGNISAAEFIGRSNAELMNRATPISMSDMHMLRATPTHHFDMIRATPPTSIESNFNKRRDPSGTSAESFQHPGST